MRECESLCLIVRVFFVTSFSIRSQFMSIFAQIFQMFIAYDALYRGVYISLGLGLRRGQLYLARWLLMY